MYFIFKCAVSAHVTTEHSALRSRSVILIRTTLRSVVLAGATTRYTMSGIPAPLPGAPPQPHEKPGTRRPGLRPSRRRERERAREQENERERDERREKRGEER